MLILTPDRIKFFISDSNSEFCITPIQYQIQFQTFKVDVKAYQIQFQTICFSGKT